MYWNYTPVEINNFLLSVYAIGDSMLRAEPDFINDRKTARCMAHFERALILTMLYRNDLTSRFEPYRFIVGTTHPRKFVSCGEILREKFRDAYVVNSKLKFAIKI